MNTNTDEFNFHEALGRIGPFSVTDTLATVAAGYGIAKYNDWDVRKTILMTWVTGEVIHWWTGVDTPITRRLEDDNNLEKILLVAGSFLII